MSTATNVLATLGDAGFMKLQLGCRLLPEVGIILSHLPLTPPSVTDKNPLTTFLRTDRRCLQTRFNCWFIGDKDGCVMKNKLVLQLLNSLRERADVYFEYRCSNPVLGPQLYLDIAVQSQVLQLVMRWKYNWTVLRKINQSQRWSISWEICGRKIICCFPKTNMVHG